jgi:mycofactocin system FadH/OYE family oxidoreductase 2
MVAKQYSNLMSPINIGPATLRNRIVSPAHTTNLLEHHLPGERYLSYQLERAKGGVGGIIFESASVHPTSIPYAGEGLIFNHDDSVIAYYQRASRLLHPYGVKLFQQLAHVGHNGTVNNTYRPLLSASSIPSGQFAETPKAMEPEDIQDIVQAFADAAKRVREGEFDGVEIHAGASSLALQFISPLYNKRTDSYGGSLDNRLRFSCEIIDAIRKACGEDFVLGFRVSGDELVAGGLTEKELQVVWARLVSLRRLDYVSVNIGTFNTNYMTIPPMAVAPGYMVHLAAGIRREVQQIRNRIVVFAAGRITNPDLAEQILAEGKADVIVMARELIADPELPLKVKEGRVDDMRPCIGCNQSCIARFYKGMPISCIHNPASGREQTMGIGTIKAAETPKRVMVVGGGPAGLEVSRVAALRGHKVTLFEKSDELGGQVNILVRAPNRGTFGGMTRYLKSQIDKLGVEVNLQTEVTESLITRFRPDAVVLATGSYPDRTGYSPGRPELEKIPGIESAKVATTWDVLLENVKLGEDVILIDEVSWHQSLSTAEFLLDQGKRVRLVTRFPMVGADLVPSNDLPLYQQRLFQKGIEFITLTYVKEIRGRTLTTIHAYSKRETEYRNVDIVLAGMHCADNRLYHQLKGKVRELYAIGDCVAPRRADMAIYEGNMIGRRL